MKLCENFTLASSTLRTSFQIKIALPLNYNDSLNFNSIYLLDANYFFTESGTLDYLIERKEGMSNITSELIKHNNIPSSVLIGIGYSEGVRMQVTLEKSAQFYSLVKDKLIPEVENRCKVSKSVNDRTLYGYSASAHFSTYSLMRDAYDGNHTFANYISISGVYTDSLITPGGGLANETLQKIIAEKGSDVFANMNFYMAVGSDDGFYTDNIVFMNNIIDMNYQNFNFNNTIYEDYYHYDIPEIAYQQGMIWLFQDT